MLHRAGELRGQVLVQGAAVHHVDHLDAPADAQHGLARGPGQGVKGGLHIIPAAAELPALVRGLLSVQAGVQVLSPGEQEPVAQGRVALQGLGAGGIGQDHRGGPGVLQALYVTGQHPIAVLPLVVQGQNGDQWLHSVAPPLWFFPSIPRLGPDCKIFSKISAICFTSPPKQSIIDKNHDERM